MSQKRDTDYLAVSTRIHAMENRMLTRERMERMIDAKDSGEAAKVLSECGYGELTQLTSAALEELLADARRNTFRDMADSVPDRRLVEVFQLKYDYHNAKVLIKAQAMGLDEARLLSQGGRYDPQRLREDFLRDDLRDWGEVFRQAVLRAREVLSATGDPQQADLVLDRACFQEMESLARACGSAFLQGYVRLSVDAANLRAAVRAARMGKGSEFLNQILLPGGNVSERALAGARPEELAERFRSGPLAQAAALGLAVGLLYDLFRVLRVRVALPLLGAVLDLSFWIIVTVALFVWSQQAWRGEIRLYGIFFLFGGGVLYFWLISTWMLKIGYFLADAAALVWRILTLPLAAAGKLQKKTKKFAKNSFHFAQEWFRINQITEELDAAARRRERRETGGSAHAVI